MTDETRITDTATTEAVKASVGIGVGALLILLGLARKRIVEWWKKPSKHDLALNLASEASLLASKVAQKVADAVQQMSDATNRVAGALETGMKDVADTLHKMMQVQSIHAAATDIVMGESIKARWTCDDKGRCVFASAKLQKLFNLSEQEMKDYGWMDRIPYDYRKQVKENFERIYREPKGTGYNYAEQYPVEQADGTLVNVLAKVERVVYDATGQRVLAVYGTCEPVPTYHGEKKAA